LAKLRTCRAVSAGRPTVWRTTLLEVGIAPLYTRMVMHVLPPPEKSQVDSRMLKAARTCFVGPNGVRPRASAAGPYMLGRSSATPPAGINLAKMPCGGTIARSFVNSPQTVSGRVISDDGHAMPKPRFRFCQVEGYI
jgi:hypothetical protein